MFTYKTNIQTLNYPAHFGSKRARRFWGTGNFGGYNESIGSYDNNGNILSLSRSLAGATTNQLTYGYMGNQLRQVEDGAANGEAAKGFVNGASSPDEMACDANGNLVKDLNRGINHNSLSYNLLNLPAQVIASGGMVSYVYDSGGHTDLTIHGSKSTRATYTIL